MFTFNIFKTNLSKERRANLSKVVISSRGGFSIKSKDVFQDKENVLQFFEDLRKTINPKPKKPLAKGTD